MGFRPEHLEKSYDSEFTKQVKKLAPHWFEKSSDTRKQVLYNRASKRFVEMDFDGWRQGWYNVKDFFWFTKRKAFNKAIRRVFAFDVEDGYVYVFFFVVSVYIRRTKESL